MSAAPRRADVSVEELLAVARSYLGVRWAHQGRTRAGVDCLGLVIATAHELGLTDFDVTGYGTAPDGSLSRGLAAHCQALPAGTEPAPGMLAEMRFELLPQHVGLIVPYRLAGHDGLGLLHAMSLAPRRVVEHRLDSDWRRRIVRLYRIPGVKD